MGEGERHSNAVKREALQEKKRSSVSSSVRSVPSICSLVLAHPLLPRLLLTDHSDIDIVFVSASDKIVNTVAIRGHLHPDYYTVAPCEENQIILSFHI